MREIYPGMNVHRGKFFRSVSYYFEPAVIQDGFTCLNIPVPGTYLCGLYGCLKALLDFLYFCFGQLSFVDIMDN